MIEPRPPSAQSRARLSDLTAKHPRRFRRKLATVVAIVAAAAALVLYQLDPNRPHGDPDPGGRRLAFLEQAARTAAIGGTGTRLRVRRYAWDHGGCDGGAPGWARAEVDVEFAGIDVAQIDAAMAAQHWRRQPVEGGDEIRDYEPAPDNRYASDASLFADGSSWDLQFAADPAQVPTHAC